MAFVDRLSGLILGRLTPIWKSCPRDAISCANSNSSNDAGSRLPEYMMSNILKTIFYWPFKSLNAWDAFFRHQEVPFLAFPAKYSSSHFAPLWRAQSHLSIKNQVVTKASPKEVRAVKTVVTMVVTVPFDLILKHECQEENSLTCPLEYVNKTRPTLKHATLMIKKMIGDPLIHIMIHHLNKINSLVDRFNKQHTERDVGAIDWWEKSAWVFSCL